MGEINEPSRKAIENILATMFWATFIGTGIDGINKDGMKDADSVVAFCLGLSGLFDHITSIALDSEDNCSAPKFWVIAMCS